MATHVMSDEDSVAAFYKIQNSDEHGEYRANKYDRALGAGFRPPEARVPALDARAPVEDLVAAVAEHGAVVLKNALPAADVAAFKAAHDAALAGELAPLVDSLLAKRAAAETRGEAAASFYKGELRAPSGLRLRTTAKGRFDLKHLDRRDGPDAALAQAVEPLVLPRVVRELLQRSMACPWRVKTVGSLPTLGGASGGDWHRDIGEGLFGEDLDLRLPDYYFNALVPLAPASDASATEILLGSHTVAASGIAALPPPAVAAAGVGDVVFFNGKCVHRGRPNAADDRRDLVYVVYAAKWFEQGRDPASELPEYASIEPPSGSKDVAAALP